MGIFKNLDKYENTNINETIREIILKQTSNSGMKVDSNNNYDAENKRIKKYTRRQW